MEFKRKDNQKNRGQNNKIAYMINFNQRKKLKQIKTWRLKKLKEQKIKRINAK